MRSLAIVGLCSLSSIGYGIAHDQITVRLCVEYFTIFHPPIFGTDDPTLLGIGWGVVATWWVGLLLGVPLAVAARAGSVSWGEDAALLIVAPPMPLSVRMAEFTGFDSGDQ